MSDDPVVITVSGEAPAGLVTEQEYNEREASRPPNNSTAFVDTEEKLDAALAVGGAINLRGVIDCATPKVITKAWTTISGPGHLRFVGPPGGVAFLQLKAPDVTLQDLEISSTQGLDAPFQNGIEFLAVIGEELQHRTKLLRLNMHGWLRCVVKYGGVTSPYVENILMEDCYLHKFQWGAYLTFGLKQATIRRCQMLAKQSGETHISDGNAFYSSSNIEDMLIEDCIFGMCGRMGCEMTTVEKTTNLRIRVVRTRIVDVAGFGVSFGHCIQSYAEQVIVDGAHGIGFEIAGDDVTGRVEDTILVACDVRNVTSPEGHHASGYTIDKANDVVLLGCRVTNITSKPQNLASGVTCIYV